MIYLKNGYLSSLINSENMVCRKCGNSEAVTVKKDYSYCESCYLIYLNHKFRACIGKHRMITPNEKILIGLSGGISSTVLLDLIHTGIILQTHKKLKLEPQFVHLTGEYDDNHDRVCQAIVQQCKSYGYNVHIVNIASHTCENILSSDLTTSSRTSSNDFIRRIKQNILVDIAKELKCRIIFTSECATNLAAKLLTDLVIGRGSQVDNDIGFLDNRHDNIKIMRPLRDVTKEELQNYMKIKGLIVAFYRPIQNNLQSIVDVFVNTLEKNSPSTISTICKTADKIGGDKCKESDIKCILCKGKRDKYCNKLTALEATIFSRIASSSNNLHDAGLDHIININQQEINNASMFPFIQKYLCYSCSRSYVELNGTKCQEYIKNLIDK